jgi:DNA mismatch repair protein MutL
LLFLEENRSIVMVKIRVLDDTTINQMAAGEVIENPASVIKELVDNSLDSGATEITVEILGGGRQLIKVVDNGCGMSQDDALLSLERHATSKIRDISDLINVSTNGFRGEALPSIASISKMTLITKDEEQKKEGTLLSVSGGASIHCQNVACAKGTTIEIKSLFFNVPVRKKFQSASGYSIQQICKSFNSIALAYPSVHFRLISDHKPIYSYPVCSSGIVIDDYAARIHDVLGGEYLSQLFPVDYEGDVFSIKGFFGFPHYTRPNRTGQYILVNRRPVMSLSIGKIITNAYGTHLSPRRHPVFVSHWSVDTQYIDVNVHPQKKEIRFRRLSAWEDELLGAIQKGMAKQGVSLPTLDFHFPEKEQNFWEKQSKQSIVIPVAKKEVKAQQETYDKPLNYSFETDCEPLILTLLPGYILVDPSSLEKKLLTHLHCSNEGGFLLLDQAAIQARLAYEELTQEKERMEVQNLLIPQPLDLNKDEFVELSANLNIFKDLGIILTLNKDDEVFLQGHPTFLSIEEVKSLLHATLGEELNPKVILAHMVKKIEHRKKKPLGLAHAQALVKKWLKSSFLLSSPQGRPTVCYLNEKKLAKLFV